MLILSRQCGDKIYLTKDGQQLAVITVTDIFNSQVRLGIEADDDVRIDREEIHYSKQGFDVPKGEKK